MAGAYDDYPDNRLAYHLDGTVGFITTHAGTSTMSAANLLALNDESTSNVTVSASGAGVTARIGLIFPALIDLAALFVVGNTTSDFDGSTLETSADTTNGVDGTWTTLTFSTSGVERAAVAPFWRTDIRTASRTGIKALRFTRTTSNANLGCLALHVFGSPSSLPSGQNLAIWHPTLDQPIGAAAFDWGDTPRGQEFTADFRVKNLSASEQANSVVVRWVDSTDSSPSFTDQHEIDAGSGYAATQNIGNLASGAISSVLTARFTAALDQPLSLAAVILEAEAGSWT